MFTKSWYLLNGGLLNRGLGTHLNKKFWFCSRFRYCVVSKFSINEHQKTCLIAIYISNETKQKFAHVWLNSFRKKCSGGKKIWVFFLLQKWRRKNIQKFPEGIISNIISHKNQENKEFCDILHYSKHFWYNKWVTNSWKITKPLVILIGDFTRILTEKNYN